MFDQRLGWKHIESIERKDNAGNSIHINSLGLREEKGHTIKKYDIIALGDSYTFGDGVSTESTWPHLLNNHFKDYSVANMGACAYGLDQMILWYMSIEASLSPKVVVLSLIEEDIYRTNLTHWLSGHQKNRISIINDKIDVEFNSLQEIKNETSYLDKNGFYDLSRSYLLDKLTLNYTFRLRAYQRSSELIKYFDNYLKNKGVKLIILKLSWFDTKFNFNKIVQESRIETIDCSSYKDHKGGIISKTNPHPSKKGHLSISSCLYKGANWTKILE